MSELDVKGAGHGSPREPDRYRVSSPAGDSRPEWAHLRNWREASERMWSEAPVSDADTESAFELPAHFGPDGAVELWFSPLPGIRIDRMELAAPVDSSGSFDHFEKLRGAECYELSLDPRQSWTGLALGIRALSCGLRRILPD